MRDSYGFGCAVLAPVEGATSAGAYSIWRWGRDLDPRMPGQSTSTGCKPAAFSLSATPPQKTQRVNSSSLATRGCWPFVLLYILMYVRGLQNHYAILHRQKSSSKCKIALTCRAESVKISMWRFLDYCSAAGNNLIEEWYQKVLDATAQAEFDVVLKMLSVTDDWRGLSEFESLGREGLCTIRFKAGKSGKIQYRPVGFFGPGERTFSIYVGCSKKGNIYTPPDAFDLALKRRGKVERKEAFLRERTII